MAVDPGGRVVVVGQGYVGLPLAMRAVEVGYVVAGYEIDDRRAKRLAAGESYVEDVSCELLAAALASGRYHPSSEARVCAGFDVAVITVPTPLRDGNPDLGHVELAGATLSRYLRPGTTVVLENTFRHVNIALVNELRMFAAELGVDVWDALRAAATKPFGFMPFTPGPGVGGHCLPIDPSYLSWRVRRSLGHPFRFVELANDINDHMPDYVVRRLVQALNGQRKAVNGTRVLLLGLSYKRNTGDARESPARAVVSQLLSLGAEVRAADPHVGEDEVDARIRLVDLSPHELQAADAVVLLTDHDAYDYDLVTEHARFVLDARHRLTGPRVEHL